MKKAFLFVAAAMAIFAGCNKEQLAQELKSNNVIHIGVKQIAPATKVAAVDIAANKLSFKWEEGDQVAFYDNERIIIYTCTDPATGEFSGEALDPDATYWVEYPNDYSGTFIYRGNQIPKGHLIMNEEVSGSATTFTLDTHETIIHFKLKGAAKVGSIALSYGDEDDYTLSCGDGVQLSDTATDFYMDAMYMDPHKLSSIAYTLRIYDTNNKELKSVSFHLKEENQETIVDFATPIEVTTTTGTAKRTGDIDVNWVQLWENGPKFAEYNVGATSAANYGGYYTWGGTYNNDPNLPDFSWTDDHNNDSSELTHTGDNITDTATKLWGSNWRMPTQTELEELLINCDVEAVFDPSDDTKFLGKKFTGKGAYASNSVFLPAAGFCFGGYVFGQGNYGYYWSSTPGDSDNAYDLYFHSGDQVVYNYGRGSGLSVRAVLAD